MTSLCDVASYIYKWYEDRCQKEIDEMKLHKLVYLVYRNYLAEHKSPMFQCVFKAWKHGPVVEDLRQIYKNKSFIDPVCSQDFENILNSCMCRYAEFDTWILVAITRVDTSWILGRISQDNIMQMSDILDDAKRYRKNMKVLRQLKDFRGRTTHD